MIIGILRKWDVYIGVQKIKKVVEILKDGAYYINKDAFKKSLKSLLKLLTFAE